MKKNKLLAMILIVALAIVSAIALTACGEKTPPAETTETPDVTTPVDPPIADPSGEVDEDEISARLTAIFEAGDIAAVVNFLISKGFTCTTDWGDGTVWEQFCVDENRFGERYYYNGELTAIDAYADGDYWRFAVFLDHNADWLAWLADNGMEYFGIEKADVEKIELGVVYGGKWFSEEGGANAMDYHFNFFVVDFSEYIYDADRNMYSVTDVAGKWSEEGTEYRFILEDGTLKFEVDFGGGARESYIFSDIGKTIGFPTEYTPFPGTMINYPL